MLFRSLAMLDCLGLATSTFFADRIKSLSSSQCLIHDQKMLILSDTNDHHITHKYGENSLAVIVPVASIYHYLYTWFLAGPWLATDHFLVIPCGPKDQALRNQITNFVCVWLVD